MSYDEGLAIIRQFLEVASTHTIEDLQELVLAAKLSNVADVLYRFTQNKIPTPTWVKTETVTIPQKTIDAAAKILNAHLAVDDSTKEVGGEKWWQFRGTELKGEFIEMAKDQLVRQKAAKEAKAAGKEPEADRVLLYIHGRSCTLLVKCMLILASRWSLVRLTSSLFQALLTV